MIVIALLVLGSLGQRGANLYVLDLGDAAGPKARADWFDLEGDLVWHHEDVPGSGRPVLAFLELALPVGSTPTAVYRLFEQLVRLPRPPTDVFQPPDSYVAVRAGVDEARITSDWTEPIRHLVEALGERTTLLGRN